MSAILTHTHTDTGRERQGGVGPRKGGRKRERKGEEGKGLRRGRGGEKGRMEGREQGIEREQIYEKKDNLKPEMNLENKIFSIKISLNKNVCLTLRI